MTAAAASASNAWEETEEAQESGRPPKNALFSVPATNLLEFSFFLMPPLSSDSGPRVVFSTQEAKTPECLQTSKKHTPNVFPSFRF